MTYPLPVFHFSVDWGGSRGGFAEVSGLDIKVQTIEYREGNDVNYSTIKMPGLRKYANIVLKRGVISGDNEFFQWLNTARLNQVERRDITIKLLNEDHEPVVVWKVQNAWPSKVEGPGLKATGNEVSVERMELVHEGLTIEHE